MTLVSEGKRKQLFNHLLHEFRNSKVNMPSPNYVSGSHQGMHQQQLNMSAGTPSTLKTHKKKSASIDKKTNNSTITTSGGASDLLKKQIPKKGGSAGTHKKSKSFIPSHNMSEALREQSLSNSTHQQQIYYQQMRKELQINGSTLENSFGHGAPSNKSYERILAETIEAQNITSNGLPNNMGNYASNQYYNLGASSKMQSGNPHNMTLQLSSKRGAGSAHVSQSRFNVQMDQNYDSSINREKSMGGQGYGSTKSNHTSHKSLSNSSKYDQQQRKKSRGQDQFYISNGTQGTAQRSKCESNRTSKKNSPSNTIISNKNTINIREARTKPVSPERSYAGLNTYKAGNKKGGFIAGSVVNQLEERKAMNMMSNINSQLPQNQMMVQGRLNNQEFVSIQQQQVPSQRKNFKNMFYSPKGGRDAYTEPHSKYPSQAHTKEHSPAHKMIDLSQHMNATAQHHFPQTNTNLGHHPKIRSSATKPPTQHIKNKSIVPSSMNSGGMLYSTKESNHNMNKAKIMMQEMDSSVQANSFLEDSYMKNATNIHQIRRDDISFDSSTNQFSQTGTPNNFKIKLANGSQPSVVKKINIVGREVITQSQMSNPTKAPSGLNIQSNSSIERKPKKIIMQGQYQQAHTTGMITKHNSQAASPTHQQTQMRQQQIMDAKILNGKHAKQRFQSEAPSPVHGNYQAQGGFQLAEIPAQKKRGISISGIPSSKYANQDSIDSMNQSKKLSNAPKIQNQNQQQFLFNQYVKSKKPRHHLDSQDASLERPMGASQTLGAAQQLQYQNQQEAIFDISDMKQSNTEISPRSKEVNLIKSLIKECFGKYNKPPKTQIELYKIGKMLGKGAFGRVNLGLHRLTRRLVAIKAINMEFMKDESSKKKMSNEISILKILRHPNVVKLLETFDTDKHHLIVMELCPGGDLLNYVRKRRKLNEKMAKFVFKQIMEGLAYLHQNGVVHRDIKLDNILLDGHGMIKLADFGVSRKVQESNELLFEQCGTPAYIAPEIVRELGYKGSPVDIWSAGVCLYAMLYGNVPFKANQMGDLNKMILDANIEYKDTASEEARDLMTRMLQKNPNKRLTAEEVLEHSWFDDVDDQVNIFDEQELDLIKKEFTYVTQKAKLKELKERKADDLNTEFTEHSINSNENTLMKNNSSRSVILCPFNTQTGAQAKSIYEDIVDMLADKDMAIRFNARVREANRQYEKFNNQDFDNGVYHKYAYNQGKNKEGEDQKMRDEVEALKEEVLDHKDVKNKNLVRKGPRRPDHLAMNYYIKVDEKIVHQVEDYGFPKQYVHKCLNDNVNNHCTTSYYLLCMDQNY